METNDIIVIGGIHHNMLGVLRALGTMGLKNKIKVIVTKTEPDFVTKTKYVKRSNVYSIAYDDMIVDTLLTLRRTDAIKPIVICCSDSSISIIDKHYDLLSDFFILPNAKQKQGEITRLIDKSIQIAYAAKCGLKIPETLTYKKGDTTVLAKWNEYPCIIKPLGSIIGSKADIAICNSQEQLINKMKETNCTVFQVQKYIDKVKEIQFIGCSLNNGDRIIIPGYTDIIRQPKNTNTGYLAYKDIDESITEQQLAATKLFIKAIGYSGLFSVEFIRDKFGTDYFLEINLRNDGNTYCVTCAGVNLPYIWYLHCCGNDINTINKKINSSVLLMPEFEDIKNVFFGNVNFFVWLKEFILADCHTILCCHDIIPFVYKSWFMTQKLFKKLFRIC